MKRFTKLLILLLALSLLPACKSKAVSMTYSDGAFHDGSDAWTVCPGYQATSYLDGAIATFTDSKGHVTEFFALNGTRDFLSDGDFQLYTRLDTALPSLSAGGVSSVQVCLVESIVYPMATVTDADVLESVSKAARSAPLESNRMLDDAKGIYSLVVYFSSAPYLCQSFSYLTFEEDVIIYEPLEGGQIPNLYPGIPAQRVNVEGENVAEFNFGKCLIFDQFAGLYYAAPTLIAE